MDTQTIIDLSYRALHLTLILSMPALVVSAISGITVALLQAVTQIQDQSVGTAVKIIMVFLVIMAVADWAGAAITNFADQLFALVATIGINQSD